MKRAELLAELVSRILATERPHPLRVGIDGVDAAGKTTLADELAPQIEAAGRPALRASIDRFHNPARVRYRRGRESPDGYYLDSFDHAALVRCLLCPLGPGGDRRIRRAVFDHRSDSAVDVPLENAEVDAVLLFDGVFLHRPELRAYWDFSVFLRVDFSASLPRAEAREPAAARDTIRRIYATRYVPGQRLYLGEAQPEAQASLVIDNNDVARPRIVQAA